MHTPAGAALLVSMLPLVALTFAVLLRVAFVRFRAASSGQVKPRDFRYGESADVPGELRTPNRILMNLLEMPVLFYVLCIALYVTGKADWAYVYLAWAFVALRFVHAAIYLVYNSILHRFVAFAASNAVLFVMWARFGVDLA